MSSMLVLAAMAADQIGVSKQTLAYYYKRGKITIGGRRGRYVLINPVVAKRELKALGFCERRENNHRPHNKNAKNSQPS